MSSYVDHLYRRRRSGSRNRDDNSEQNLVLLTEEIRAEALGNEHLTAPRVPGLHETLGQKYCRRLGRDQQHGKEDNGIRRNPEVYGI